MGALAVGAAALGALAIGRVAIKGAVIRHLRIEELEVGHLRVRELEVENERRPGASGAAAGGEEPLRPPAERPLGPPD